MEVLIKTILGKTSDTYLKYIEDLLSEERLEILSEQEKEMIEYLKVTYEESEKFPTEDYFLKQFPEYSVPLDVAETLEIHDLDIHYRKMVKKRSKQLISRKVMQVASKITDEGFSDEVNEELNEIYKLNREVDLDDSVFDLSVIKEIYERKKNQPLGIQTYINEVDEKIGGMSSGSVNIIFGWTGSFKTTFAINIAYNNTYKLGYNVVYISLEVPKEDIIYNILSRHSFDTKFDKYPFVGHRRIRQLEISEEEEEYVFNDVLDDFMEEGKGELVILDETDFKSFTFPEIRKKLEEVDERIGGIDGIIWDHANLFKFSETEKRLTQNDIINEYVSWIRQIGIKWLKDEETGDYRQLTNIILAQANRQGWKKADKNGGRYDLTAIAEANELERSAYRVFSVYTSEDLKQSKECTVQILKNRSGPTMYEPLSVFADPEPYVIGDDMEGFDDFISTDSFGDIFDDDGLGF